MTESIKNKCKSTMANLAIFFLLIVSFTLSSADNERISERLVGGSEAHEEQFPYQVSIFDLFIGHFCGGSILSEKWILTAARCVRGKHPSSFHIGAGITNWSDLPDAIYLIDKVIVHDSLNLALIKLRKSLPFSTKINKIDLPSENMNIADTSVVISGWGSLVKGGKTSRKLLFLKSKIFDLKTCKEIMSTLPKFPPVTDENLCTFTRGGEGLCDGDSGNPVVSGNYQVGVVLHGHPCALGYPDISVNVWNYTQWIKSHINEQ